MSKPDEIEQWAIEQAENVCLCLPISFAPITKDMRVHIERIAEALMDTRAEQQEADAMACIKRSVLLRRTQGAGKSSNNRADEAMACGIAIRKRDDNAN